MTKAQQPSQVSTVPDCDPAPPRGLSKAEKREFQRICGLRRAAGRPVSPIEVDILLDYMAARDRLAELQRVEWKEQDDEHFFLKERIALSAAVDRAAATCRRLARDLKLVG